MTYPNWWTPVVAGLAAVLLTACGDPSREAQERHVAAYAKAQGLDIDVQIGEDGETERIAIQPAYAGGNATVGRNLSPPADFPADVALYPGMELFAANRIGAAHLLQARAVDPPERIAAFYQRWMMAAGWGEAAETRPGPGARNLRFSKGGRIAAVNLITADGVTTVQLSAVTGE